VLQPKRKDDKIYQIVEAVDVRGQKNGGGKKRNEKGRENSISQMKKNEKKKTRKRVGKTGKAGNPAVDPPGGERWVEGGGKGQTGLFALFQACRRVET